MKITSTGSVLRQYISRLTDKGIEFSENCFLAGGAIRRAVCGQPIDEGDFDIWVTKGWQFEKAAADHNWKQGLQQAKPEVGLTTYNFVVDGLEVQLHYTKKPVTIAEILNGFDFTCCQFACDGDVVYYVDPALADAKNMLLRFTGSFGAFTLPRVFRFQKMGFKPVKSTLQSMEEISAQLSVEGTILGPKNRLTENPNANLIILI